MIKKLLNLFKKKDEEKPKVYWFLNGYGRVELDGQNYVPSIGELIFLNFTVGHANSRVYVVVAVKPTVSISKSGYLGYVHAIKVSEIEVVLEPVTVGQDGLIVKTLSVAK